MSVLNAKMIFSIEFDNYYFSEDNVSDYFLIPALCHSIQIKIIYIFFNL